MKTTLMASVMMATAVVCAAPTTWTVSKTGDDTAATADISGGTPFQHIQAAITNANTKAGDTILIGPGVYGEEEGVNEDADGLSRICVTKKLTLRASDPAQETAIVGKHAATESGMGEGAVRCMKITATGTVVEGLTLRDGATHTERVSASGYYNRSGAIYTTGSNAAKTEIYLVNCTVSNCVSWSNGAIFYCTAIGCRVAECSSTDGVSAKQGGRSYFTLFDGNASVNSSTTVDQDLINCTYYGNSAGGYDAKASTSGSLCMYNSLFSQTKGLTDSELAKYVLTNRVAESDGESMADPANGDFRVRGGGVAFRVGDVQLLEPIALPDGYVLSEIKDPFGNAINTGALHVGAVQGSAPYARLVDSLGELRIEGGSAGWNELSPGDSISVSVKSAAARPCTGLLVNGAFVPFDDLPGRTYVLTAEQLAAMGGCAISPVYTADWYLSNGGNDENSGFTPDTAKKTFASLLAAVSSGDTVHVSDGVYGSTAAMTASVKGGTVSARVVVPAGVTVKGAGAGKTFILGASASAENEVLDGCGTNAMICVFLNGVDAKVADCTLCGGRSQLYGSGKNDWKNYECNLGGGVASLATYSAGAYVENCVISNCTAARGGAAYNATLVKCRVQGNKALDSGGGTLNCRHYGSLILGNTCQNYSVMYPFALNGCTVAANALTASSGQADVYATTQLCEFKNTFIAGNVSSTREQGVISHCVFAGTTGEYFAAGYTDGTCIYTNLSAIAIDQDGRPVVGLNPCVGMADESYYDFERFGAYDLSGAPRIMNGTMDIGALEGDYRPLYKSSIGMKNGNVTDVTRGVVLDGGGTIRLSDGDALTANWVHRAAGTCSVRVTAPDGGTVTVMRNGEVLAEVVGPADGHVVSFQGLAGDSAADGLVVSYAGAGSATFSVSDVLSGTMLIVY